jgi:alcohol dehydrogenase
MIQTQSFVVNQPTQIQFGVNSCANLHETIKQLGGSKVFLVVDPGLKQSGIIEKVTQSLEKADTPYTLYDNVQPEPGLQLADTGAQLAKKENADCVVGVGGGSALDIAKAISILLTNGGKAEDYLGSVFS